jgi:hypothetical protein
MLGDRSLLQDRWGVSSSIERLTQKRIDSPHTLGRFLYLAKLLQQLPSSATKGHIVTMEDYLREILDVRLS